MCLGVVFSGFRRNFLIFSWNFINQKTLNLCMKKNPVKWSQWVQLWCDLLVHVQIHEHSFKCAEIISLFTDAWLMMLKIVVPHLQSLLKEWENPALSKKDEELLANRKKKRVVLSQACGVINFSDEVSLTPFGWWSRCYFGNRHILKPCSLSSGPRFTSFGNRRSQTPGVETFLNREAHSDWLTSVSAPL